MNRIVRFAPCALLLTAAIVWGKHSITPTIERLSATQSQILECEKLLAEWHWVESEAVPVAEAPAEIRRLNVDEIAGRVAASRVSLARLAESADGAAQFEIRSDFSGLMTFLDRIAGSSCQVLGVRRNGLEGIRATFRMEAI